MYEADETWLNIQTSFQFTFACNFVCFDVTVSFSVNLLGFQLSLFLPQNKGWKFINKGLKAWNFYSFPDKKGISCACFIMCKT
jgi:hypothetical protein